jgi:hypothetical protein
MKIVRRLLLPVSKCTHSGTCQPSSSPPLHQLCLAYTASGRGLGSQSCAAEPHASLLSLRRHGWWPCVSGNRDILEGGPHTRRITDYFETRMWLARQDELEFGIIERTRTCRTPGGSIVIMTRVEGGLLKQKDMGEGRACSCEPWTELVGSISSSRGLLGSRNKQ